MTNRVQLTVPGRPIPLQRSRTRSGKHYLPKHSRAYRETVQGCWLEAGRPSLGGVSFSMSARFYGARANADLDNLVKQLLDALNELAFADDRQLTCMAGVHKLSADADGPRTEIELWPVSR
ncbi:MAG: RusA family crossover junction endodeoxyribonuclease [Solirubrobacterales bacterium]